MNKFRNAKINVHAAQARVHEYADELHYADINRFLNLTIEENAAAK